MLAMRWNAFRQLNSSFWRSRPRSPPSTTRRSSPTAQAPLWTLVAALVAVLVAYRGIGRCGSSHRTREREETRERQERELLETMKKSCQNGEPRRCRRRSELQRKERPQPPKSVWHCRSWEPRPPLPAALRFGRGHRRSQADLPRPPSGRNTGAMVKQRWWTPKQSRAGAEVVERGLRSTTSLPKTSRPATRERWARIHHRAAIRQELNAYLQAKACTRLRHPAMIVIDAARAGSLSRP